MSISLSVLGFLGSALAYAVGVPCFKKADRIKIDHRAAIIFSLPVLLSCFLPLVVRGEFFLSELNQPEAVVVLFSSILITYSSTGLFNKSQGSAGVSSFIKSLSGGLLVVLLMFLVWVIMLNVLV